MPEEVSRSSQLLSLLRRRIARAGPLSVAEFTAEALLHRQFGYYTNQTLDGSDFITAPQVSQLFGELIGAWILECWYQQGCPQPMALVELGPGQGYLMSDILRLARANRGLPGPVFLVEASPLLRQAQERTLRPYRDHYDLRWIGDCSALPDRSAWFVIANEFFDALPVRQFQRSQDGWHERLIGLDGDDLVWVLGPCSAFNDLLIADYARGAGKGCIVEIAPARTSLMMTLADHICRRAGAALVVDYGYTTAPQVSTLQAVRRHQSIDVLEQPGSADLTTLVDFAGLVTSARGCGAHVCGPITQGRWLTKLGIRLRAQQLIEQSSETQRKMVEQGVEYLLDPEGMGGHFLVLEVLPDASSAPQV